MASKTYVAYCGGKWEDCTWKPPHKDNVRNLHDGSTILNGKNETDADAFIFEKDEDSGNVQLHVFKTCCSPKMTCTYSGAGKIINDNTNIWQKILDKGTENEIRVMADYNKFTDANIRIGSYGNGEAYEGFASPSTVEYSFINGNGNDIPEATNPSMFENVETLVSCDIPCQMRFISDKTFYGCKSLTSYSSPDWIDTIGVSAFEGCTSMINLVIGKNAKLSTRSFAECTNATTIEWSGIKETDKKCRITDIADSAFLGCTSLRYTKFSDSSVKDAIIIPKGISGISEYAFSGCSSIHNLKMYDVTTIGGYAFQGCTNLQGISGMSNVTSVGEYAFDLNGNFWTTDSMGDLSQITSIGEGAFSNVIFDGGISLTNSNLTTDKLGDNAFSNSTINGDLLIGSNIERIPYECFYFATITGKVYIYSNIAIGKRSFSGGNLQHIIIEGSEVEVSRDSDSFDSNGPVVHLNGYTKGSTAPADYPSWVQYYEGHNWQSLQIVDSAGNELYSADRGQ